MSLGASSGCSVDVGRCAFSIDQRATDIPRQRYIPAMHVQRRFSLSRREGAYGTAAWVGLRVFLFTLVDCILPASSIDIITAWLSGCQPCYTSVFFSRRRRFTFGRAGWELGGRWPGQAGDSATPCCGVAWFCLCLNNDCLCILGQRYLLFSRGVSLLLYSEVVIGKKCLLYNLSILRCVVPGTNRCGTMSWTESRQR